jgi:hypothetical protein
MSEQIYDQKQFPDIALLCVDPATAVVTCADPATTVYRRRRSANGHDGVGRQLFPNYEKLESGNPRAGREEPYDVGATSVSEAVWGPTKMPDHWNVSIVGFEDELGGEFSVLMNEGLENAHDKSQLYGYLAKIVETYVSETGFLDKTDLKIVAG